VKIISRNNIILCMIIFCQDSTGMSLPSFADVKEALQKKWSSLSQNFKAEQKQHIKNIDTSAYAQVFVERVVNNIPAKEDEIDAYLNMHKANLLRSAKILSEESQVQILKALQEIDRRLMYWHYQKNHWWGYFFGKNPLKWVIGKSQVEEIEENIVLLKNKQQELYFCLGELSAHEQSYLISFNDYLASYEWIDQTLEVLSHVTGDNAEYAFYERDFISIIGRLSSGLKVVASLDAAILSSIASTAMPYHFTRNWLRYGLVLAGASYAYKNPELVDSLVGPEALQRYQASLTENFKESVADPLENIGRRLFGIGGTNADIQGLRKSLETYLDVLAKPKYAGWGPGYITPEQKILILSEEMKGNLAPLQSLLDSLPKKAHNFIFGDNFIQGESLLLNLRGYHAAEMFAMLRNVALLTPATIAGWIGYSGYKKVSEYDYKIIRYALADIAKLIVTKDIAQDNAAYGKLLYSIYNLKQKVTRDIFGEDRRLFLHDLKQLESRAQNVDAKKQVIDSMFKQYSFLKA